MLSLLTTLVIKTSILLITMMLFDTVLRQDMLFEDDWLPRNYPDIFVLLLLIETF